MPAVACRDSDETCDWFFREEDYGRLMIVALQHDEDVHVERLNTFLKAYGPAAYIEEGLKWTRPN